MKGGERKKKTRKTGEKFIGGWIDDRLHALVEEAIRNNDTDRSKFLRKAIREKLARDETALVN